MKKIKSAISILLVSMMLFAVAAAGIGSASADDATYEGTHYQYTVANGEATITRALNSDADVTVPSTLGGYPVTTIGKLSFRELSSLRSVFIPASVKTIEESAFNACIALESVTFADNSPVKELPKTVFNNNRSLKTINFGSNSALESIGESAFWGCTALETIIFPDSVKNIGATAFEGCSSLKDITITKNVATIGDGAFVHCVALENFKVDPANANFSTDHWGILYNKDKTAIVVYPAGSKRPVYTIPAYITKVEDRAFMGAIYLEDISWLNPYTSFGLSAFSYCTNLYRATVPEGTVHLSDWIFNACFSLAEVNLPDSIESFGAGVFHWCTALTEFTMPANLYEVTSNSFRECYSLKKVVLNDSLEFIGPNAFSWCFALEEINLHENIKQIGSTAFYQCYSLKEITFPTKVRYVNSQVLRQCYGLESVTLSPNAYEIDTEAFMDCRALKSINIPSSLNSMNGDSFISCIALETVNVDPANTKYKTGDDGVVYTATDRTVMYYPAARAGSVFVVPDSVDYIQKSAFISAQNLASIVIPASVTAIRDNAFDSYNICDIYYEGTEEQWNAMQVADDEALKSISVHFNHKDTDHVHDYAQEITITPTCDKMGQKSFTCSCGKSVTKDWHYAISKSYCYGINFECFESNEPDCTTKNYNTYGCSECEKVYLVVDSAKLGHDFDVSVSDTKVSYACNDCSHTYDEPIPEGARYAVFAYDDASMDSVYILNPGDKLAYPVTPVKEGLEFAAWVDAYDGSKVEIDVMPDKNLVLVPFFEKLMKDNIYRVSVKFDEDCFAEGYDVDLVVDEVSSNTEQGAILFKENNTPHKAVRLLDIAFESAGEEIQPRAGKSVELRIPVPKGYEYCEEFLICHRHENVEDYETFVVTPVDGYLVFTATRFSKFEIYVKADLGIATLPAKTSYAYKDSLDISGLTLIITDDGGNTVEVTDTSKMKVTGYDPKKVGTQKITVEYEGFTTDFNVTVEYTWWQWIIRILLLGFLWY